MNNPRLKGIVERFATQRKLDPSELAENYQLFSNYSMVKEKYYEINGELPYESLLDTGFLKNIDLDTEKQNAMAVDGCFAVYKKQIIHLDLEEGLMESEFGKIENAGIFDVVLIQTKTSGVEPDNISALSNLLSENFRGQAKWAKLIDFRNRCERLIQDKPNVKLRFSVFYVLGKPMDNGYFTDPTFLVRKSALLNAMKGFFWITEDENVSIEFFNDSDIYGIYESQNSISNIISHTVLLSEMTNEIECGDFGKIRFGVISFGELMKILYDGKKNKPNELYAYNVRGEIESSPINKEIVKSIEEKGEQFLLLNNGITMIVDKQERKGDSGIYLENIQIVNGCQTSHSILKSCLDNTENEKFKVPVKIIQKISQNTILADVTYSSNNQNQVSKDNLFAIQPKIFELEKLYIDFDLTNKTQFESVLFERRQGQFNNQEIPYIDMLAQAKAYISLWNKKAHISVMYKDISLDEYEKELENASNFLNKSLIAGVLWHNIFKRIPEFYEVARYQIFATIVIYELERKLGIADFFNLQETETAIFSRNSLINSI